MSSVSKSITYSITPLLLYSYRVFQCHKITVDKRNVATFKQIAILQEGNLWRQLVVLRSSPLHSVCLTLSSSFAFLLPTLHWMWYIHCIMEWRNSVESGMRQRLQLSVRHVASSASAILHVVNFKNCQANQSCNLYYLLANHPTRPSQCTRRGGSRPFGVRAAVAVEMDELPLRRSDVTDHNSLNLWTVTECLVRGGGGGKRGYGKALQVSQM